MKVFALALALTYSLASVAPWVIVGKLNTSLRPSSAGIFVDWNVPHIK